MMAIGRGKEQTLQRHDMEGQNRHEDIGSQPPRAAANHSSCYGSQRNNSGARQHRRHCRKHPFRAILAT